MTNTLKTVPTTLKKKDIPDLIHAVNTQSARFSFAERFMYKIESLQSAQQKNTGKPQRKITVESHGIMELFLIRQKLKGKKKPVTKKNHDAQQFASVEEGDAYLNATKHFFTNFNLSNQNLFAISDLEVCKSDLQENFCFVLTCDPSYFFGEETDKLKQEYFMKTYVSLLQKRKIYKIPSVGVIFVRLQKSGEIIFEINKEYGIFWFQNRDTILAN